MLVGLFYKEYNFLSTLPLGIDLKHGMKIKRKFSLGKYIWVSNSPHVFKIRAASRVNLLYTAWSLKLYRIKSHYTKRQNC